MNPPIMPESTESTHTRVAREFSIAPSARPGKEVNRIWPRSSHEQFVASGWDMDPPSQPGKTPLEPLDVVMVFGEDVVRMEAVGIGVSTGWGSAQRVYGHLVDAVRRYLETSNDKRAELPPDTWFNFVLPNQTALSDRGARVDGLLNTLNRQYEFGSRDVEEFIRENPWLGGLLFEAKGAIRKHFGPNVVSVLEVVADPEALGDRQLFVLVRTEFPRKEARARLARLDREWWLDTLPAVEGKMEIALA